MIITVLLEVLVKVKYKRIHKLVQCLIKKYQKKIVRYSSAHNEVPMILVGGIRVINYLNCN